MATPDMIVRRIQVALFCRINLQRKLGLADELSRRYSERFDGEPIIVPAVPNAPVGLPAFALHSTDGNRTLTVRSGRVDVGVQHDLESSLGIVDAVDGEADFVLDLVETLSEVDEVDDSVHRIGVLLSLVGEVDESAVDAVRRKFLAPGVNVGRRRFQVGFMDRLPWDSF